jgi:universal stress protein E
MTLRILAATDLSVPSLLAVTGAARLTAAAAARLDIVHVIRQWRWTPLAWLRNAIAIEVAAERRLAAAVADAVKEGAEARGHLVTGAPVATLEALSRELAADLVVLGTRGSRGLLDGVLGTTAERLIERLPCAALVVRQRARAPYRTLLPSSPAC